MLILPQGRGGDYLQERFSCEAEVVAKKLSNVAVVRKPLRRGRGLAILSVPGLPKRKSWPKAKGISCREFRLHLAL